MRLQAAYALFAQLYRGRERGIRKRGPTEAGGRNGTFLPEETLTLDRFPEHIGGLDAVLAAPVAFANSPTRRGA